MVAFANNLYFILFIRDADNQQRLFNVTQINKTGRDESE